MRQISGEIRVVHFQNYQLNSISRVRTELILLMEIFGGPCRIRTHVSGSEGRKDIQTTLTARASCPMQGFAFQCLAILDRISR